MIMGAFIPGLRRKYPPHEYLSAVLLVVGLILFTLADAQTSPNFSVIGVIMVSGALVMDSFLGNFQEAIFTMNPETTQVNFMSYWSLCGRLNVKKKAFMENLWPSHLIFELLFSSLCADRDAVLFNCSGFAFLDSTHACNGWIIQSMELMFTGNDWTKIMLLFSP